ncbi:MltG/YceG/YrrL family protein [Aminipila terrae]|uniref:Endolytic transglycosylase MltG n=1 Tax=Aminipila terrae TaxID=2697030 RepID=A0A6P1MFN8_9FIRM|nr:endolytic transglycosylase MltG [Aminipila terrae]QHI72862.1 hypothetical protein Ami3637_11000 [Aminipila terrae]
MGKVKDILYDISDILTAFCIVMIAGIVIWVSIGNIMQYPSFVAAEEKQSEKNTNFGLAVPVGDGTTSGSAVTGSAVGGKPAKGSNPELFSIYINYGESVSAIAQKFVDVGLFKSVDEFKTLVNQKNAASKLKSGNFIIPANATPDEVINKITTSPSA